MQSYLIALSRRTQFRSCLFVALSAGILVSTSCSKPKTTGATQFTLTVAKEGTYDVKTAVSSELGTGNFHLEFKAISGGSAVVKTASIKVPKTGSVDHYKTMVISGIQLTQGKQIARVVVDSASASGSAAARSSGSAKIYKGQPVALVALDDHAFLASSTATPSSPAVFIVKSISLVLSAHQNGSTSSGGADSSTPTDTTGSDTTGTDPTTPVAEGGASPLPATDPSTIPVGTGDIPIVDPSYVPDPVVSSNPVTPGTGDLPIPDPMPSDNPVTTTPPVVPPVVKSLSVLPIGDSMTAGYGSGVGKTAAAQLQSAGGYRVQLYADLRAWGTKTLASPIDFTFTGSLASGPATVQLDATTVVPFDPHHDGHAGDGIAELTSKFSTYLAGRAKPDIILVNIGIQDVIKGRSSKLSVILPKYRLLLDQIAMVAPDATVLVSSLAPIVGKDSLVKIYNQAIQQAAAERASHRVIYVPIYEGLSFYLTARIARHYSDSGVFLNTLGYTEMAQIWFNAVKAIPNITDPVAPPSGTDTLGASQGN